MILYAKPLQIGSDGKILLKTWHVYVGYVFSANLIWRFIWAFIGGQYACRKAFLPGGKSYLRSSVAYLRSFVASDPRRYIGHNPIVRLMITIIFLLLSIQAITGLILVGTEVYMPPLGAHITQWVSDGDVSKRAELKPGSKDFVDAEVYAEMRRFRAPIIKTHLISFYTLMVLQLLHITAAVLTEIKSRNGIISTMFTGEKWFDEPPLD